MSDLPQTTGGHPVEEAVLEVMRRWRRKCGGSGACRWWVARFLGASEGQCSGIALAPEVDLASALRNARGAQLAAAPPCSACRLGDIG